MNTWLIGAGAIRLAGAKRWAEVERWAREALEIDVQDETARDLYLKALTEQGKKAELERAKKLVRRLAEIRHGQAYTTCNDEILSPLRRDQHTH